jgi:lipopolysaccharide transport system permease protein
MSAPVPAVPELPVLWIKPSRGWKALNLREIWTHRELLFFFIWRDVKVRYKQTVLGAAWAILQPLLTMIIFTVFFGRLARVGSDGLPYPVFSYTGLLPWTFFAHGITHAATSVVGQGNLIKKIYFPRLIVPIAQVVGGLVDFCIAFLVLIAMMIYYGIQPTAAVVFLPLLLFLAMITALGVGLWIAALTVEYRDFRYVVPFMVQMWLFVTPVIYPASRVTAKLAEYGVPGWLYGLNPMAGVVEGFRWALLGSGRSPGPVLAASALVSVLLLVSGAFFFRRMEKTFADVV